MSRALLLGGLSGAALLLPVAGLSGTVPTPTPEIGGTGGVPFVERGTPGASLVGFEVWEDMYGPHRVVSGLRPLFRTASGRAWGHLHGRRCGQGPFLIEARKGYAVADLDIRGGDRVDGFSVLFRREGGPARSESYRSGWVGGRGGGEHSRLLPGGAVVGLCGASGDQMDRLGLLLSAVSP